MHSIVSSQSKMMQVYETFGLSAGRSQIPPYVSLDMSWVRIYWLLREELLRFDLSVESIVSRPFKPLSWLGSTETWRFRITLPSAV